MTDFAVQQNDDKGTMNTGFFYLKPNEKTLHFLGSVLKLAPQDKMSHDQTVFKKVYKSCLVYHANYAIGVEAKKLILRSREMWTDRKNSSANPKNES
jgi:hypothetical protein